MKLSLAILGLAFAAFGVYSTFQAWNAAASGHLVGTLGYVGPFLIIMGLYRVVRALAGFPPNPLLRYGVLGVAVLIGWGDSQAIKSAYPNAVSITSSKLNP